MPGADLRIVRTHDRRLGRAACKRRTGRLVDDPRHTTCLACLRIQAKRYFLRHADEKRGVQCGAA